MRLSLSHPLHIKSREIVNAEMKHNWMTYDQWAFNHLSVFTLNSCLNLKERNISSVKLYIAVFCTVWSGRICFLWWMSDVFVYHVIEYIFVCLQFMICWNKDFVSQYSNVGALCFTQEWTRWGDPFTGMNDLFSSLIKFERVGRFKYLCSINIKLGRYDGITVYQGI